MSRSKPAYITERQQPSGQSLDALLQHPAIWQAGRAALSPEPGEALPTGYPALDQALPQGGWPCCGLLELLCPSWGVGEIQLLSAALAELSRRARWIVWVAPPWIPYAPALVDRGIAVDKLLLVRADTRQDQLWAMEQSLASGACSAVLGWQGALGPGQLRRLQLAARKGRSLGVMLRSRAHLQQASPAPLRLELGLPSGYLHVRVVKCRGGWGSAWLQLPWRDTADAGAALTSRRADSPVASAAAG